MTSKIFTKACFGAALAISLASAQSMSKPADVKFADAAAHGGAAEVMMGKLAAEKASDPDVKAFGQQMVDDHSKANDQLMSVAKSESMTLPSGPDAKQKAAYAKLSALSGASFDKAYVKVMVKDHEEDVADFQKEANMGKDEKIKSFASQTLPVLQGHLDKIKSIQAKMMSGNKPGM
jgi:putative membrane protein